MTPQEVALIANNVTAAEQTQPPFQIYHPDFLSIIGQNASLTLIANETHPLFHEAGVVTSLDPLTLFTASNQFNTSYPSPETNGKTIVVSRTVQDKTTGIFRTEVVNRNVPPLLLANGGFPYRDGILFTAQGTRDAPGGLVYLPTNELGANLSHASVVINNYLGRPFNSPNDVYVARNGVVYFTDPTIGYQQDIRPVPQLGEQVFAFVPNTTIVRPVADHFGNPNGVQLSPDELSAYVTDTIDTDPSTKLPSFMTIYKFDVMYPSMRKQGHEKNKGPARGEVGFFANRRVFAVPSQGIPDGIKLDSRGNVYAGCGDGINVWNENGILLGKIVVQGGTSNFGFASDGRIFALNEEKLYLVRLDKSVQPAVPVGERRG